MSSVARSLRITMGTLTVAVNNLVKKGYVIRTRSEEDRRVVYASLTPKGNAAYTHHMRFHRDMIKHITDDLSEDEAAVLIKTFTRLEDYFKSIS